MTALNNKLVLITGGASGIGRLMGKLAIKKGAHLIIWDIDEVKTQTTVDELSEIGKVNWYKVDISDIEQIKATAQKVKNEIGVVDILINNAGIVVGKYFSEHSESEITNTMNINANAPMLVTKQFLLDMMKQNSGHICNIASSAGLTSNPRMSVYASSKWAVIGWSDSLRLEMLQQKMDIGITTVTPYYINTGMFDGVKSRVPILNQEKVARKIIRAIERNRIILSMPWSMHFVRFSQGLLPIRVFDWFVGKVLGVYSTMEHFEGHKK